MEHLSKANGGLGLKFSRSLKYKIKWSETFYEPFWNIKDGNFHITPTCSMVAWLEGIRFGLLDMDTFQKAGNICTFLITVLRATCEDGSTHTWGKQLWTLCICVSVYILCVCLHFQHRRESNNISPKWEMLFWRLKPHRAWFCLYLCLSISFSADMGADAGKHWRT